MFSFKGGVHPFDGKCFTEKNTIETYLPKGDVVIPLSQHIGAPCEPIVKKGQRVLVGEKIGDSSAFISAPVHASVSGTVKNISPMLHTNGLKVLSVVIENDNQYEEFPGEKYVNYENLSKDEIVKIVHDKGIVGLGGACFPTYVKFLNGDKKVEYIVVNAAECEPYLTCNDRVMQEDTSGIKDGFKILSHMYKDAKILVGVEDNKKEAINVLKNSTSDLKNISIVPLRTMYPQGAEKQLIYALTKREVPSGKLPLEVGCIVLNINTVLAVKEAVIDGKPLIDRVMTVAGCVKNPKNIKVKIGTNLSEVIEYCGGYSEEPGKVISGGPMMGFPLFSLETPCLKSTSALLCFSKNDVKLSSESNCIRCGKCLDVCPMSLNPTKLNNLVLRNEYGKFENECGLDCIECGCCSYICPAKRHLVQSIKEGKKTAMELKKKEASKDGK